MRRVLLFRLGTRDVHLTKLFGAFLIIAAALMVVQSITSMFDSWENVKAIHSCIDAVNSGTTMIQVCQAQASDAFGFLLRANQYRLTDLQVVTGLFPKVAAVFGWVAILIAGIVIYRAWHIMLPYDQEGMTPRPKWKGRKR